MMPLGIYRPGSAIMPAELPSAPPLGFRIQMMTSTLLLTVH
jgi:hypothetical protein